jgi:hypothetical protein
VASNFKSNFLALSRSSSHSHTQIIAIYIPRGTTYPFFVPLLALSDLPAQRANSPPRHPDPPTRRHLPASRSSRDRLVLRSAARTLRPARSARQFSTSGPTKPSSSNLLRWLSYVLLHGLHGVRYESKLKRSALPRALPRPPNAGGNRAVQLHHLALHFRAVELRRSALAHRLTRQRVHVRRRQ